MATASEIIASAYRESNLVGVGRALMPAQEAEGLNLLNSIIPATIGQEVGEELRDVTFYGLRRHIPVNARLVCAIGAPQTAFLHPDPYDGQRFAVVDLNGEFAVSPLTLDGNGRNIEGAASLNLNEAAMSAEWLYRADLGNWVRITSLELVDDLPLPREFDDYFSILLAMRLNPRHGRELAVSSGSWLESVSNRMEARYRRPRRQQDWGSPGLYGQIV